MPIIKNNLYHALTTETITKPVSAVKLQLDVLDGCKHKCPGCFVHRRGNSSDEEQFKDAIKFVDDIASRGILIDEIIIGPTDFLSSENFYEVMPHLVDMINEHSPILAFITTLIDDQLEPWVKWLGESINLNTEIEIGIAIDPYKFQNQINYVENIKRKLNYISDNVEHDVVYTFLLNIKDYGLDYLELHEQAVKEFTTTIDFIPSVSRSAKPNITLATVDKFNEYFNILAVGDKINNIMVDHSHAGMNYTVLNYKKGTWWLSPFLYENMVVENDIFKIETFDDVAPVMESQLERAKGTECETCPMLFSCYNRKIILLRDYLGVDRCIAPKENMINNMYNYDGPAQEMYDWSGYTPEADKNGYRKKFTLTDDTNNEELERIKGIFYT
jgi:hypothetical protein